jgi:ribosomal protein L11 methyltransferase
LPSRQSTTRSSEITEYLAIEARAASERDADIASAEAFAAGATGIEERSESDSTVLLVYAAASVAQEVRAALCAALGREDAVGMPRSVEPVDWTAAWRDGIGATVISPRLVVRPSFVSVDLASGQREIVIDPGQAFGTGGHASTALALEWIDELFQADGACGPLTRVLDVGTGTGVLALAALRLGAERAIGFDLDPIAVVEARIWARHNDLDSRLALYAGPLAAIGNARFDLVLANLLRRELLPLIPEIARLLGPGGVVVVSGLLRDEWAAVCQAFEAVGIGIVSERSLRDDTGDTWISLRLGDSRETSAP